MQRLLTLGPFVANVRIHYAGFGNSTIPTSTNRDAFFTQAFKKEPGRARPALSVDSVARAGVVRASKGNSMAGNLGSILVG